MTFVPPELPSRLLALTAEDRTLRNTRRSLRILTLLLTGVLMLSVVMVIIIAQRQNHDATDRDRQLLRQMWQSRQETMLTDVRDYAFWGEAWRNLHASVNKTWAWDEANFGPDLYNQYHYEGVFIIDGQGRTRYAMLNGKLAEVSLEAWLGQPAAALLHDARKLNHRALARNVVVSQQPGILVAAPVTMGKVPHLPEVAGAPSVMVFVNLFTPEKLQTLGKMLDVRALRDATDRQDAALQPGLRQETGDGTPVVLRWQPKMPGTRLLLQLLPILAALALITGWIACRVSRHALNNAALSDRRFAMLALSQQELASSEARFRDLAEAASDWIWETDEQGHLIYLSSRFQRVTGHLIGDWTGQHIDRLLTHPSHSLVAWLMRQEENSASSPLRCQFMSAQGERRIGYLVAKTVWHKGRRVGFRGTVSDITQSMEAEARIEFLSHHDPLTGLSNRAQLRAFLTQHLEPAHEAIPLTIVSLDIDQFKPLNDTWGHAVGDLVLNQIAQRLQREVGADELAARLGGNEFVLVLQEGEADAIAHRCTRLLHEVQQPVYTGQHAHYLTASIGIARAPQDASQPEALLRLSDIALNEARAAGRNRWVWYASNMASQHDHKREMAQRIEQALHNDEFILHYQPRYQLQNGRLAGAEALIRWQPASGPPVAPDRFIPLAEENGLIVAISDWVLARACGDASAWGAERYVSVNISPVEFRTTDLVQRVARALEHSGLPATRLELEITENVTFEHPQQALEVMQGLRALGVRLTVDDFGTGYAALGYLKTFPFNGLKIDRSWMKDFPESQQAESVVAGIIALAHAFALTITAEGIETEAQLDQLKRLSCEEGQGYFLGRPMPLVAFTALLETTSQTTQIRA
ncbi:EAL domain-containing protein [Pantoea sp. KPR_PJ]|uniref:bifunctional diguanylate cyclase/phosphodiesterase n=1 Tax=Pantoea sp. KPR_PJ TaxID=2738375 RepID=UPI0035286B92